MFWLPYQVIESEEQNTNEERDNSEVFVCVHAKQMFGVEAGKLADHPVAVCGNPNGNGKVVA